MVKNIQMFFDCQYCNSRIAVNYGDDAEWDFDQSGDNTWWSWPPKQEGWPETCPRCGNEETYVEQAELILIEIFYEYGYRQWSRSARSEGWRLKFNVEK